MNDAATIARAYIDTWNALDGEQLGSLLAHHWAPDAHYGDPLMEGDGHASISGLVQAVQQRFPEYRFALKGQPDGYGETVRLSWTLGQDGEPPAIEGSDVLLLRQGQIERVIGFIDRMPAQ